MYFYKRGKTYWVEFTHKGERIRQSTACTSLKKATEFGEDLRTDLRRGTIGMTALKRKEPKLTFKDAVARFITSLNGHVKESTIKRYESASKVPIDYLGKKAIKAIDRNDIEGFTKWRQKQKKKPPVKVLKKRKNATTNKTVAPATINRELALIRMVINHAKPGHWSLITSPNGGRRFKFLEEDNERDYRIILSPLEENKYLVACSQPLRDLATVMLDTGMRPGEVLALENDDVDLTSGTVRVRKGKTKAAKRTLRMTSRVRSILELRVRNSPNGLLFPGGKDRSGDDPIVKLNAAHLGAVSRAKVKALRLYDLRHCFATRMVQNGVDLVTLAAILGHSNLKMVMRYTHPTEQHQAAAFERLEKSREEVRKAS